MYANKEDSLKATRDCRFIAYNTINSSFNTYDKLLRGIEILSYKIQKRFVSGIYQLKGDTITLTLLPNGQRNDNSIYYNRRSLDYKPKLKPLTYEQFEDITNKLHQLTVLEGMLTPNEKGTLNVMLLCVMELYMVGVEQGIY